MEGIPKDDLAAWRKKRDEELGNVATPSKRPRIYKGVVSLEDLAKQLAVHRNLMKNSEMNNGLRIPPGPGQPMPMPPPGLPGLPGMPGMLPGGVPLPPPGLFPLPPG